MACAAEDARLLTTCSSGSVITTQVTIIVASARNLPRDVREQRSKDLPTYVAGEQVDQWSTLWNPHLADARTTVADESPQRVPAGLARIAAVSPATPSRMPPLSPFACFTPPDDAATMEGARCVRKTQSSQRPTHRSSRHRLRPSQSNATLASEGKLVGV
jgi:hypothetical protein